MRMGETGVNEVESLLSNLRVLRRMSAKDMSSDTVVLWEDCSCKTV